MEEQCKLLFEAFECRNGNLAEERVVDITNTFLEDLDQSDAEYYVLTAFNNETGILAFIEKASVGSVQNIFDKAVRKSFELIYTLIKNFPVLVRDYQNDILKIGRYVALTGTYLTKVKALETLQMIFTVPQMNSSDEIISRIWDVLKEKLKETNDTVYNKSVTIMGLLLEAHPESKTKEECEYLIKNQFIPSLSVNKASVKENAFKAITKFLKHTEIPESCIDRLFQEVRQYCVLPPQNQYVKLVANRAALDLLAQHTNLFSDQIFADCERLEIDLRAWLVLENADNVKAGIAAVDAFYKEMGDVLKVRRGDEEVGVLRRIIDDLQTKITRKNIQTNVMRVYIRGLGYMADAVKAHFGGLAGNICISIKQQIEFHYELKTITEINDLENLPDYLFALSNYVFALTEIDHNQEIALQKVCVLMVRIFPRLSPAYHVLSSDTFFLTMHQIYSKNGKDKFEEFLADVIGGCIKWSCSHYVASEIENLLEDGGKFYTYKRFMPFWKGVLNWNKSSKHQICKDESDIIKTILFDELMRTLFTLIEKLNISISQKDFESNILDIYESYEATKKSDYNIFVNITDLYADLMHDLQLALFKKWVNTFFHHITKKCAKHPLASGFYKLISAGLILSDKLDYFNENRLKRPDVAAIFQKLITLIQNQLHKIREYKDDLLLSSLQMILSAPMCIIDKIDADYSDLFAITFTLSRTNYPLGKQALKTLERWKKHKDIKVLLKKTLPYLDPILRTHSLLTKKNETTVAKYRKNVRRRKIIVDAEPELLELKRMILCFLAQMGEDVCWDYVNASMKIEPMISGETHCLRLPLFADKMDLLLDKLVPRVVEQALYCSDRKLRVNACELLHSMVMMILGGSNNISDSDELFKTIASAIVTLAVDSDATVYSLFSLLSTQMMHWYASSKQLGSKHTEMILEILLEAITNPNDAKIRDHAGSNLKEFVNWSRRTARNADNSKINEIINKLKYFSTHPDNSKRLGSALIFNNIYRELREEERFINLYWLELLNMFVLNLSSMHDRADDDCLRQVNLGLDNILRVLIERHDKFAENLNETQRPIPQGFHGNSLKDVVDFLIEKTHTLSVHCRRKCMNLYSRLIKIEFPGKKHLRQLKLNDYKHHANDDFSKCKSIDEAIKWLNSLRCLIDGYIFSIRENIDFDENEILNAVDNYFKKSFKIDLRELNFETLTADKIEDFNYSRALLVEENLCLAKILLEHNKTPSNYFNDNLNHFFIQCIFENHKRIVNVNHYENVQINLKNIFSILTYDLKYKFFIQAEEYLHWNFEKANKTFLKGVLFLFKENVITDLKDFMKNTVQEICDSLLESDMIQILHPSLQEKNALLLELALENREEFVVLSKKLCNLKYYNDIETNEPVAFGLHLFHIYKKVLIKFLVRKNNFEIFLSEFFKSRELTAQYRFISQINEMVLKNIKQFDCDTGKYMVEVYTGCWQRWFEGNLVNVVSALQMFEQLAYLQGGTNTVLLNWVLMSFRRTLDDECGIDEKFDFYNQRIYLLGLLVDGTAENSEIKDSLRHIRSEHADLLSKQSTRTSTTLLVKTYFEAAHHSKSCEILMEAMDLQISSENDFEPKPLLEKFFKNTDNDTQKNILNRIYKNLNNNVKLIENFTILLSKCDYVVFENFYIDVIKEVFAALENKEVLGCLLLEAMFFRINNDKIGNKSCPITNKLMDGNVVTGKEMQKKLLSLLLNVCKNDAGKDFQCFAYNTFVSLICNSKITDLQVYKMLFTRSSAGVDILWRKIVGEEMNFNFDVRNSKSFSYKEIILKIRSENNNIHEGEYIESQNLFTSSLCEDIGRHDFTYATMLSQRDETDPVLNLSIQLTNEEIDQHPCMGTVCGVVKHLFDNNLLDGADDLIVKTLRSVLLNETTINSVKVFLVKMIDNTRMYLKESAKWLVGPVMKVLADGSAGECINSFAVDVMYMLLTDWSDVEILNDDKSEINRLLKFLMNNLYSEFPEILKYNLSLLKAFVEKWKDDIIVPHDLILNKLNEANPELQKHQIIIHIINILMVNELEPWGKTMKTFWSNLIRILDSEHKIVYRQCAETIGLLLNCVSNNDLHRNKLKSMVDVLKTQMEKIRNIDKRAHCLEGFSKHFPEFCEEYLSFVLRHVTDNDLKTTEVFLKILKRCSALSLSGEDLLKLLDKSDDAVLEITLEMVKNFIETSQRDEIIPVIKKTSLLVNSNKVLIRLGVYEAFISAYRRFNTDNQIFNISKNILLRGLLDTNAENQERVLNFWLCTEELRCNSKEKLIFILQNIYIPEIEENFLGFSTLIMLSNLRTNTREKLFQKPLHKCEYTALELSPHWKAQHSTQVPLFTSSLSSQGEILATQALNFAPTLNSDSQKQSALRGESSLYTATMTSFKNPNNYNISQKYKVFRKRFNKDKQDSKKYFAEQNVQKNFKEKSVRKEAANKRDRTVSFYRSYRKGDFPDIEITREDVLNPLKGLAKNDPLLARTLFTIIFDSVNSEGGDDFIKSSGRAIDYIFETSANYTPPLMATFLDIALKCKNSMVFNPRHISKVSQNSRLLSLGANILEEYLLNLDPAQEIPNKRARSDFNDNAESVLWIKLAELYKEMDDWDVVRSIFTNKLETSDKTLKAIEHEALGEWNSACTEYKNVILEDTDADRKDFYYESLFRTFSELSSWSELAKQIEEILPGTNTWTDLWEDEWNRKKLLPAYIKSKIRDSNSESRNGFFEQISCDLKNQTRALYLKDHHSEDLAVMSVLQNNLAHSKVYLDIYINNFLQNWSCLNPLFSMLRGKDLISMRNALDVYIFTTQPEAEFYKHWESSEDELISSIAESEARNFYRKEIAKIASEKSDELKSLIDEILFNLDIKLIENALNNGNFNVARKYFKAHSNISKNPQNGLKYIKCTLLMSKLYYLSFKRNNGADVNELKRSLLSSDKCLKHPEITQDPKFMLNVSLHIFKCSKDLHNISTDKIENISSILKQFNMNSIKEFQTSSENSLIETLSACESLRNRSPELIKEIGNCYYKLASNACERKDEAFIRFTLKAMFYQSQEAVKLFPCLLNLEDLARGVKKDTFLAESRTIESWLFIKWIPQLLAFIDTNHVACISEIVIKIAEEYPYSIIYAYRLSKSQYKFEHDLKEESKELCQRLDRILCNPTVDKVLEALYSVVKPEVILNAALKDLKNANAESVEAFRNRGKEIFEKLFPKNQNYGSLRGIRYRLLEKYKNPFDKLINGKYQKPKIDSEIIKLFEQIKQQVKNETETDYLECYSPWLDHFSMSNYEHEIEIPGQYTGNGKPLIQYHVKLAGFDRDLLVLNSLRKPIRIKMLGSNMKEYKFLVKYGEDLRQDQRIQQMFKLINDILIHDPMCNRQKLRVVTFEVIPLKSDFGLIEWVDDTEKMCDFIVSTMSKGEKDRVEKLIGEYQGWIAKSVPKNSTLSSEQMYAQAAIKYDKTKTEAFYRSLVNKVPWDALRKSFCKISADTESLFALKQSFIKSYSVMCLSNWLLGIGDRHLSNILIALKTGEAVGIDFGMAFGTATQQLGVPELVPFRLTPQMVNLTQPHGVTGIFKETMIHILKSLRINKEILLSTMNVFIQEPMLDWLVDDKIKDKGEWLPQQRIGAAQRKFDGVNPCVVMMNEIRNRGDSEELKERYVQYLRGNERDNFRARVGDECLSAEEQVKCLLDQATDANLLGRMYHGWESWV